LLIFVTVMPLLVAEENQSWHPAVSLGSSLPAPKIAQSGQPLAAMPSPDFDQWDQERAQGGRGAAGNAWSRQNSHYASEVIAGTLLRTVTGRTLLSRHGQARGMGIRLTSYFDAPTGGLALSLQF
jgi:hypothetical protein